MVTAAILFICALLAGMIGAIVWIGIRSIDHRSEIKLLAARARKAERRLDSHTKARDFVESTMDTMSDRLGSHDKRLLALEKWAEETSGWTDYTKRWMAGAGVLQLRTDERIERIANAVSELTEDEGEVVFIAPPTSRDN